ncbi:MAG: DNA polymerase III, subunit gamma and tau [Crocinitomicaceae bacterium]|nr:DNA polymerase III, subunit gamma and tau [Crocinitomicaceae bacterium]|tara:strand:+ start:202 stop:1941 length:1740 start_codon:yes stop_codon:yes gene_type:complete
MSNNTYTVSALKYRPDSWETIVGQPNISSTLQQAIKSEQLAQAYLFCGPRGVGKTSTARLFAKSINLAYDNKLDDFSYNIYELDAASNNQVDDIRNLNDQVRIPPQIGKYKVYIIDEVHMLSQSAFNAFLKTLEEPPPHAVFILATTEKHKIIPTILSRCQVYDFHRISIQDMVDHLSIIAEKENVKYDTDALHVIAEKADGALRDALSCFDLMVNFCDSNISYDSVVKNLNILDHDYYFKITDAIIQNKIHESLTIFNDILSKGFDGHLFINGLGSHFRNLLVSKDNLTINLLEVSEKVKTRFLEQSNLISTKLLIEGLTEIGTADVQYKSSKNQRLHVEITLMKLCSIDSEKKKSKNIEILPPDSFISKAIKNEKVENTLNVSAEEKPLKKNQESKGYEDVISKNEAKPIVVRPKPLKIKKRSITASISNIRSKMNEDKNVVLTKEEELNKSSSKFSIAILKEKWLAYAEKRKNEGKHGLFATMSKSIPSKMDEDFLVEVVIDSKVQQMEFQKEIQDLLDFLRTELNNGHIQLDIKISESNVQKLTHLTSRERFFQMAEKNPDLNLFKDEFDLDIEY